MTTTDSPTVTAPDRCPAHERTIKATGHKVWCTNGRKPLEFRVAAHECKECGR